MRYGMRCHRTAVAPKLPTRRVAHCWRARIRRAPGSSAACDPADSGTARARETPTVRRCRARGPLRSVREACIANTCCRCHRCAPTSRAPSRCRHARLASSRSMLHRNATARRRRTETRYTDTWQQRSDASMRRPARNFARSGAAANAWRRQTRTVAETGRPRTTATGRRIATARPCNRCIDAAQRAAATIETPNSTVRSTSLIARTDVYGVRCCVKM